MKVSALWLREWVDYTLTEDELAHQLTMAGLEVDSVNPVAQDFSGVVVAEVLKTSPHPDADKLTLCEVNANTGSTLAVVCGAQNVRPGLIVALATIGAKLPGGLTIKETKLRGALSQGMLCSATELGIADQSEGILELPKDAPIGMDVRDYLGLNDHVLDIDLTPNRADCFSVMGIAREVSVLTQSAFKVSTFSEHAPTIDDALTVKLINPEACSRYLGRVIRGINPDAETPIWMSERLRRGGIRCLHPVVDIMNYVMLELGQPMHAFDLQKLQGGIQVRFAKDNEELELLDGQEVKLNTKVLVIADDTKPLAIAGIMGGAESAVSSATKDVFLESAFFAPVQIAGVARSYGLFSDSSQRYERGVDPYLQRKAIERASELILSIVGGQLGPVVEAVDEAAIPNNKCISFNTAKVKKLTGLDVPVAQMIQFLTGLGANVKDAGQGLLEVTPPSHRFDMQLDVDFVEEIGRLFGYDKLDAEAIKTEAVPASIAANEALGLKLSRWFKAKGYHETISYSFVDPELQQELYPEQQAMQLINPISSELSQMRVGMWPGLLASLIHNVHRQQQRIRFFEQGVIFDCSTGELVERPCVAGLMMGEQGSLNWSEPTRAYDFFDGKGDLQSLFAFLGLHDVSYEVGEHEALHPGQCAKIKIGGQDAGWLGVLHPKLQDALDLTQEVILFELNSKALHQAVVPRYRPISKYPQIRRDLSFLLDENVKAADIEKAIFAVEHHGWLKAFELFDVYQGKGIPEGKKSIAVAMILQDEERTLVDSEINELIGAIIKKLEQQFSITLRD